MPKSPDAFRTISEVADWLDVQAHVLRFWESKFTQVKPIKRAGGRRYYRPADMLLLGGIKKLLHDDGLTIKGVQKILREEGMGHVSALSTPLEDQLADAIEGTAAPEPAAVEKEEKGVVLDFSSAPEDAAPDDSASDAVVEEDTADQASAAEDASDLPEFVQQPLETTEDTPQSDNMPAAEEAQAAQTEDASVLPEFVQQPLETTPDALEDDVPQEDIQDTLVADTHIEDEEAVAPDMAAEDAATANTAEPDIAPKPRIIDLPDLKPEADIAARPSTLTAAFQTPGISRDQAREIAPLLSRLAALRDRMHAAGQGGGTAG